MPDIVGLLRQHYDATYGTVNVRAVLGELSSSPDEAFAEMSAAFTAAEPQWRLPILEGMRTLAAAGRCREDQVPDLIGATEAVAADVGSDEHFKSINALVMAERTARALPAYATRLLERHDDSLAKRLAFYTVAMLLEHRPTDRVTASLRGALESAAAAETSDKLKREFEEILERLRR